LAAYPLMTNRVCVDRAITLRSVNGSEVTVIQGYQVPGQLVGDGAIRCAYVTNGAALSGFTLASGSTGYPGDYWWPGEGGCGGGVYAEPTNAVITNCTITGNVTPGCGGGACGGTLWNCKLTSNSGTQGRGGGAGYSILNHCLLADNLALSAGGAAECTLNDCVITNNWANFGGGTVGGLLNNCTLVNNQAYRGGAGAVLSTLNNCFLTGNSTWEEGGAAGSAILNNCTITGNYAFRGAGAYASKLTNCILFYNSVDNFYYDGFSSYGASELSFCCTSPMPPSGIGNITNEPVFVDLAGGNLRL